MIHRFSIHSRLSLAFVVLGMLVLALGFLSARWLSEVNDASAQIRDRWLQSLRLIGDLNNYTSDYRAAEASHLLAGNRVEKSTADKELSTVLGQVDEAWRSYEAMPHDAEETRLWRGFQDDWNAYLGIADRVVRLSRSGSTLPASDLYRGDSRASYVKASDALGALTDLTVARARLSSHKADETFHQARVLIFGAIVSAVVLVMLVMTHISIAISGPLRRLTAHMLALARNQTDITLSDTERQDEIGEMARAVVVFRDNAVELVHSKRGLEQQASMLAEKLEHEQRLTDLQRNFVAMASHEFRTPLTVIDGHAQRMIKAGARETPEELLDRAEKIRTAVRRMTHLLESLINTVRVFDAESGLFFHPSEFDPATLVHEVCQMHREVSGDAWVVEHLLERPVVMHGDTRLLSQAVSNLISNGIKFSPVGKPVQVSTNLEGDRFLVTVRDDGIGIPAADLPGLFQRYSRGSNARSIVGTGIGLYLVRTVAHLHGGEITVESREGKGSRFVLSLPLRPPTPVAS